MSEPDIAVVLVHLEQLVVTCAEQTQAVVRASSVAVRVADLEARVAVLEAGARRDRRRLPWLLAGGVLVGAALGWGLALLAI